MVRLYAAFICGALAGRENRTKLLLQAPSFETDPPAQLPVNRIIKQGRFDWGSFSAFEDGSFEVERAGVTQWFRNFSELERSLKKAAVSKSPS